MYRTAAFCLLLLIAPQAGKTTDAPAAPAQAIRSEIRRTAVGERILVQEVWVKAPRKAVWDAYTTRAGWMAWAAPQAEVDLRVGGTIRTNYRKGASLGDKGTNTLHIRSYVPEELLTLQAELDVNWPEVMQLDAGNLSNTIVFREHGPELTQVISYGVGYGDREEYDSMLTFFVQANEGLFAKLIRYLEEGEPAQY